MVNRDHRLAGFPRRRGRRVFHESVEKKLDAEIIGSTAKKNRRRVAPQNGLGIEAFMHFVQNGDFFFYLRVDPLIKLVLHHGIGKLTDRNGSFISAAGDTLKKMDLILKPVINPFEIHPAAQRPVHRKRMNGQHLFNLVDKRQRGNRGPVQFIDEGEYRNAAVPANFKKLERLAFNTLSAVNDHHHGINGHEYPVSVLGEIFMARSI